MKCRSLSIQSREFEGQPFYTNDNFLFFMERLLKKLGGFLKEKDFSSEKAVLKSVSGRAVSEEIRLENYEFISKSNSYQKLFFVDGGSTPLLSSASFALGMFRACIIKSEKSEFSVHCLEDLFCAAIPEKGFFVLSASPNNSFLESIKIKPRNTDDALDPGIPWRACSAARRLLELSSALKAASESKESLIVLDGSLDGEEHEKALLDEIRETALKNNNVVLGLSKSNSFSTDKDRPLSYALLANKKKPWIYKFVLSPSDFFSVCFVKLHEHSDYSFRVDYFPEQIKCLGKAIESLSGISDDSLFYGYPYGLIEADSFARISLQEKELVLASIASEQSDYWSDLEKAAGNPHKILDSAKF